MSNLPTTMIFFSFSDPAATSGCMLQQPQSTPNGPGNNFTFQGPNVGGMMTKTVSYAGQLSDCGFLILFNSASPVTYTLPNPPPSLPQGAKWRVEIENIGTGTLTVNPNGLNLNGSSSSLSLTTNQGCTISTDGMNYGVVLGSVVLTVHRLRFTRKSDVLSRIVEVHSLLVSAEARSSTLTARSSAGLLRQIKSEQSLLQLRKQAERKPFR